MGDLKPIEWRFELIDEVESTQKTASLMARQGAPEGTVVVARTQTAGRGRAGRSWVSPAGGLYMSMVLRPSTSAQPQLLPLVGALSVTLGISSATGLRPSVRWPNDVVIGGKKVSGIIAESSYSGHALSYVVVGVGLNCNSSVPLRGSEAATSLSEELGRAVDVAEVRQAVLEAFGGLYDKWLTGDDVVEQMKGVVGTLGKRVLVRTKAGTERVCTAVDLDHSGGLVILNERAKSVLHAEDVEWLRETQ